VELEGGGLRAFFQGGADPVALAARFGAVSWRQEADRDWVEASRANWEPLAVGTRFFLVPEWRNDPAPEGRFRIVVNPGMAFGTGRHETTQLCLEALERHAGDGARVLDVGTGSGILAQAATMLGAARVWACDIDPDAVEIARIAAGPDVFIGSADAIRSGTADVITANISAEAIVRLAPDLLRALRRGGVALVSGFEQHEAAAVQAELERCGGAVREARCKGNWVLVEVGVTLVGGV